MKQYRCMPNVYEDRRKMLVRSSHQSFFDERTFSIDGHKYREVEPKRSKLYAAVAKGISQTGIKEDSVVLYLGASHGYTVSFLGESVKEIYALDFAPRVVRDLIFICRKMKNIAPLLDDAFHPERYRDLVPDVDVVFMDIAQKNQSEIFIKNCDMFLKPGGFGLLALKARSVDVTKRPKDIFKRTREELEKKYVVVDYRELHPFEEDHAFFVIKKK